MIKMKKLLAVSVAALALAFSAVAIVPSATTYASGGDALNKVKKGFDNVQKEVGAETNLEASIGTILGIVYSIIGIVAVIMVILGGISYATSQGDPGRIKKGKDTILYGIIGLIIVLLAFAITQFVLNQLS